MIRIHAKTRYLDNDAELKFNHYSNGSIAIYLLDPQTGERLSVATVALDELPDKGCVFLKGWSENQGIPECLVKEGVVELTGKKIKTGFCEALEAKLLINLEKEL